MKKNILLYVCLLFVLASINGQNTGSKNQFTNYFNQESCTFRSTGRNKYFILEPNFQLTLEGLEGKDSIKLIITVLNETKNINNVETRIVEEREIKNGKIVEISRNYFAFCKQTNSVFYFGEDVENYKHGKIINHNGS